MALFIVFEGCDGSGKTTQSRTLLHRLHREGCSALLAREPGGTPLGEAVRRWLKVPGSIAPLAEMLLFTSARAQLVSQVIRPALGDGVTVICDRFAPSTVAYQGYGRGLDLALIHQLNRLASDGLIPHLTVLLDLHPEAGLARKGATRTDSFDAAPLEFHRRVRQGYLAQAAEQPDRWLVLDATRPRRELAREIWAKVQPLL